MRGGQIDYLMLDYLAEVTMNILQKQKSRDATAGYDRDFVSLMREILPDCVERNIKVTANAGGVNAFPALRLLRRSDIYSYLTRAATEFSSI